MKTILGKALQNGLGKARNKLEDGLEGELREGIRKKAPFFWTLSKRGGGSTRIQKFWASFFYHSFGHYGGKRGGGG